MARRIDHLARVRESFDKLTGDEQADALCDMFTNLDFFQQDRALQFCIIWKRREDERKKDAAK